MNKILFIALCCLCLVGCNLVEEETIDYSNYDIETSLKEMSEIYYNNELNGNKQFFGKRIKTKAKFEETSSGTFSGLIAYFKGID